MTILFNKRQFYGFKERTSKIQQEPDCWDPAKHARIQCLQDMEQDSGLSLTVITGLCSGIRSEQESSTSGRIWPAMLRDKPESESFW